MSLVKEEMNAAQLCHGCLSSGRRTAPLGDYSGLYFSLIGPMPYPVHNHEDIRLCWECRASLCKLQSFQSQLKTAQHILLQMMYQVGSEIIPLSKLSITRKDCFDYEVNHTDTSNPFTLILAPSTFQDIYTDEKKNIDESKIETDTKEIDLQNISTLTTVKVEHTSDSPNDYDCDLNYDYYDTKDILKEEKVKVEKCAKKAKSSKEKSVSLVSKYRKYARLLKSETKDWGDKCEKYFTKVSLTEVEIEDYLNQVDRPKRSFGNAPYKCKECVKSYLRAVDYYRHIDLNHHQPNTPYQCRVCKATLPSLADLAEHWRSHTGLYRCGLCGDYSKPRMLKRHLNQQHTKLYGCTGCRLEFGSLTKFAHHYKEAHGTFTCDYCNKHCSDKKIIEKHITRRHMRHPCTKCNRTYKNYTKYRDHLRLFHPKQLYKNANLELAYCVECDRQYPSVYKYKIHIKESPKHTPKVPGDPIPCPECGKTFSRKSYMNNHYRHSHLKVTKFHCELCNKYYANGYGLRQHRNSVHLKLPKMKDKICDICGRGFHTNGVLIKHRRTHTGERPYQCAFCSAAFAQITACKTHARTQHRHHF